MKEIKKIIKTHFLNLKNNYITNYFDVEDIHHFRVEYKKIRALSRMLNSQKNKTKSLLSKKLKTRYNLLGSIRDLQLQELRILAVSKNETILPFNYIISLKIKLAKLKKKYIKLCLKKPFKKKEIKSKLAISRGFKFDDCKNYLKNKFTDLNHVIKTKYYTDVTIHLIRKALKDIFYNLKIFKQIARKPLSLSILTQREEEYYLTLLEELGHFQDISSAQILLNMKGLKLDLAENSILKKINKHWTFEKIKCKKQLIKKLNLLSPIK